MGRFRQRVKERLKSPRFAEGYYEIDAELQLMAALNEAREQLGISQQALGTRIGRKQPAIARLFSAADPNPTLGTVVELIRAMGLSARIELRKAKKAEAPLSVSVQLPKRRAGNAIP